MADSSDEAAMRQHEIDELRRGLGELRRKTDEKHTENTARFERVNVGIERIEKQIADHAASDTIALHNINIELTRNTGLTDQIKKDLGTLLLVQIGRATLSFGKAVGNVMKWIGATTFGMGCLYGLYLWGTGHAPFPLLIPH